MSKTIYIKLVFTVFLIYFAKPVQLYSQVTGEWKVDIDTSSYLPQFYPYALDYNLLIASSAGYISEIERLVNKGADVNREFEPGFSPLFYAVANNRIEAVSDLIEYGANVNVTTKEKETPLIIAIKQNNTAIAELLLRAGASVDFQGKANATPVHFAVIYGYTVMTDMLLYYNASTTAKTTDGYTPLQTAVWTGNEEITDLLLQNGADPDEPDNEGFSPLMMASWFGDTLIMDLLLKKNAELFYHDSNGRNALTVAITAGNEVAVKFLLNRSDKWKTLDDGSMNPYTVASRFRKKPIIGELLKKNITGPTAYYFDQISFSVSSRFSLNDISTGFNLALKEPHLNGGVMTGCDTKLWYTRVLEKTGENEYVQYFDRSSVAYAGLFRDFNLTERPGNYNFILSASVSAGYTFGNKLKGSLISPGNKMKIVPSLSVRMFKLSHTFSLGLEYLKTPFYNNGPLWIRAGFTYNYFTDKMRFQVKPAKWY